MVRPENFWACPKPESPGKIVQVFNRARPIGRKGYLQATGAARAANHVAPHADCLLHEIDEPLITPIALCPDCLGTDAPIVHTAAKPQGLNLAGRLKRSMAHLFQ